MSAIVDLPPASRILLVEDNPGDADLTTERIADVAVAPYELRLARSLNEATAMLSAFAADAIILDLNLPDSMGLDTLERIKSAAGDAAIIVVSGLIDDELRSSALRDGAEEVFSKDDAGSRLFARSVLYIIERNTERNHAREQHHDLERLLDNNPDAIVVVSARSGVRYVNRAAVALFQRGRSELIGSTLELTLEGEQPISATIQRKDGERLCEISAVATSWLREPATLAAIRDITDRKRIEAVREANRLRSEFLSNMSHELRTPLNGIIGFSELLADPAVDASEDKRRTYLGHVLTSARHLLRLVNDILDLAKADAGKITFLPEELSVDFVVGEVVDSLGGLALQSGLHVEIACDQVTSEVRLDPLRLKQVLYNYLSNAMKVSPRGSTIVVRASIKADQLRLEVEDHGPGIAPEQLPRLFGEFEQLSTGSTTPHQGTGLGLALTKRLVEAQGGTVGVTSELGKGSTFFAELPCRGPRPSPAG